MNTTQPPKIPAIWRQVRPGEIFNCTAPLHRIEAIADLLEKEGRSFTFSPSRSGYYVTCVKNGE